MKKIALSLMTVVALLALTAGATSAVFTSTARVTGNTWSTGSLEIRIDGRTSIHGFNVTNSIPGDSKDGQFGVNNYGPPWFMSGSSTLPAKTLKLSAIKTSGSTSLFNELQIVVKASRTSGVTWVPVYSGPLSGLSNADLLSAGGWADLIPGSSEDLKYTVTLPLDADSSYMGKTTTFDFVVDATSS